MNLTWTTVIVIAVSACILACIGTCILIWYMAWHDGYAAGRDAEKDRQARRRLRETRSDAVIRAKTGPDGGYPPWYVTVAPRRAVAIPGIPLIPLIPGAPPVPVPRRATDTGELRALTAATDHFVTRVEAEGAAWREQAAAQ